MDQRSLALLLISAGVFAVILGLLVSTGALSWFGRLPGDFELTSGNVRVYLPITSMILVSIVLSAAFAGLRRLL